MTIYVILFCLLIASSIITWKNDNSFSSWCFWALSLYIILLPALRDFKVGTDTVNYIKYFQSPVYGYGGQNIELGFQIWNDVINSISPNPHFYLFLTSFISVGGVIYFIYQNSSHKIFSLFLYVTCGTITSFYMLTFSGLRQIMAISMFLISLNYYVNKKNINAIIFFSLSVLFHTTVLYCLPIVLIFNNVVISKRLSYILIFSSFVIGILDLLNYRTIIDYTFKFLGGTYDMFDRYDDYSTSMNFSYNSHRILWDMLPLSLLCFACYKFADQSKINNLFLKLFLVGLILNNVIISHPISFRLVMYLLMMVMVVIPYIFDRKSRITAAVYATTTIYFFYKTCAGLASQYSATNGDIVVPYYTFFN
ncbi:EpsG family protein [Spirosoma horti]